MAKEKPRKDVPLIKCTFYMRRKQILEHNEFIFTVIKKVSGPKMVALVC